MGNTFRKLQYNLILQVPQVQDDFGLSFEARNLQLPGPEEPSREDWKELEKMQKRFEEEYLGDALLCIFAFLNLIFLV